MAKEDLEEKQIQEENEEYNIYEAHYKETSNQGLVADDFHGEAPLLTNEQVQEFEDKDGIKVMYGYNSSEAKTALKIFQKDTIYKKNMIYTGIIFVIFVMYVIDLISATNKTNMFLATMCVLVMVFIWYFPLNHIKQMVKVIDATPYEENNLITFYEDAIMVGEGETGAVYKFNATEKRDLLRVWETKDIFVVGYGKERVFIVPKHCCGDYVKQISAVCKNGLNDRYKIID